MKKKKKMPDGGNMKGSSFIPSTIAPSNQNLSNNLSQYITGNSSQPSQQVDNSLSSRIMQSEQDAFAKYSSKPQKAYPTNGPKVASLTQGNMRGATPNVDVLNDIVSAADRAGVPRDQLLAMAANESMFGAGYREHSGGRRGEDRGILQQNVISAWNVDDKFRPKTLNQFAYNKRIPGVTLDKDKQGYMYNVNNPTQFKQSLDSALNIHPEWIDQYQNSNAGVIPKGDLNYFDLTAQALKKQGINSNIFQPGDPNYGNRIEGYRKLIDKEPSLKPYLQKGINQAGSLRYGGQIEDMNKVATNNQQTAPMAKYGKKVKRMTYDDGGFVNNNQGPLYPPGYPNPTYPQWMSQQQPNNRGDLNYPNLIPQSSKGLSNGRFLLADPSYGNTIIKGGNQEYTGPLDNRAKWQTLPPEPVSKRRLSPRNYNRDEFEQGGFINGSQFDNCYPNYTPNYNGNSMGGIPPRVYDDGGFVNGSMFQQFPYNMHTSMSGYGELPPAPIYAYGGIVPTASSFAGSPFPNNWRGETYPSYSEYPADNTTSAEYLSNTAASGIHINPKNKGKFNALKKRTGKSTEELTHSKNPKTRQRAVFAQNASKWNHADNGGGPYGDINSLPQTMPIYNPMNIDSSLQNPYPDQVSAQGYTPDQQQTSGSKAGNIARAIGSSIGSMHLNDTGAIMGLAALSNSITGRQDAVNESATQTRRNVTKGPVYDPYRYGTGSSALYANGGNVNNHIQQALNVLRQAGYDIQMDD